MMARFMPLMLFLFVALLAAVPLLQGKDPSMPASVLVGKPMPAFAVDGLSDKDVAGKVFILNFFASWCVPCIAEQPVLMAAKDKAVIYGIAYKDKPDAVVAFLKTHGNPYRAVGHDRTGNAAIDFGVYGVPETFVIDAKGIVRLRHAGPLLQADYDRDIAPLLKELQE